MDKAEDFVRAEARTLDPREILVRPVDVLLGVSAEGKAALAPLGILTVFDLASSSLFHAGRDLGRALNGVPSSLAEHGQVPGDVIDDSARGNDPETLALCPIDVLRAVGPDTRKGLEDALHVANVRDLGLWPPYRAARFILAAAYGDIDDKTGMDPEAPADLIPVNGRYPTERVQYATLVFERLLGNGVESVPLARAGQVDVTALGTEAGGYFMPAVGALLTYQQSWYARGLTLGNLIHSVALGPGESTKIAVVDWSRRTRTGTTEDIQENEVLQEDLGRVRALTEITGAVAKETQSGRSAAQTLASAWERGTADASASTGVTWDSGPHPGVRIHGETTGESGNRGFATSWSTSSGQRDVAAKLQQDIADRTQQAAHSTRTRRASIVREASQQESETLTTRTITNYNHMHALTVQYYEVVQQFRAVVELVSAERVLFVPLKPLDFTNEQVIDRYRGILAAAALTPTARELLLYPRGTTRITSPLITGSGLFAPGPPAAAPPPPAPASASAPPASAQPTPPPGVATKPTDAFAEDRWTASNIVEARDATAGLANILDDGRLALPADAVVWDVDFLADEEIVKPVYLRLGGVDGTETTVKYGERGWDLSGNRPRLDELASIRITTSGVTGRGEAGFVSCIFSFRSRSFRIVFPVRLVADQSLLVLSAATVVNELSTHLMQSRLYYSRAIWSSIDDATLGILLSRFTVPVKNRETPLVELVDPAPVGLVGNLLGFRAPGLSDEKDLDKVYGQAPREDHIPVPSGGVFAEAVLGRFNSAERLDITRFWDWADSPIPVQAPDIAALGSGSRGTADDLRPGQLSSPVLNIVNPPGLPDPTGMAGVLAAIQNGMMFRDMSGLAGTIGLAQAGVAAAQQGAQHAAEQAGLNAAVAAELGAKVAEIVGKLIAAWTTGGAGAAAGGAAGGGSGGGIINAAKGMSKSGSLLNYGRDMDARGVEHQTAEKPGAEGSGGGSSAGGAEPKPSPATGTWEADAAGAALGLGGNGPASLLDPILSGLGVGQVELAASTLNDELRAWKELIRFRVPAAIQDALKARDMRVQRYEEAFGADINLDYFPVEITRLPSISGRQLSPAELLKTIRLGMAGTKPIFIDPEKSVFEPYASQDEQRWKSDDPLGAVIFINIPGLDNAAVVLSAGNASRWIFTTITAGEPRPGKVGEPGQHPVTGNREWGISQQASGGYVFYTRGADRASGFAESQVTGYTYGKGDELWFSLQKCVAAWIKSHGGQAKVLPKEGGHYRWTLVRALLKLPTDI